MKEVCINLHIGDDFDCEICSVIPDYSIVHACQTCHEHGIRQKGRISSTSPLKLVYETDSHLYLNLLDVPQEYSPEFANPIFKRTMQFIHREIQHKQVLIHCNWGLSRSPSFGLVYMAIIGALPNASLKDALAPFIKIYPKYAPGTGVGYYMEHNWDFLMHKTIKL
ncbi:MAG: hypothetical protein FWG77_08645 [Treponema sp.]|nr:hypothetical protein [Treponema sp.]